MSKAVELAAHWVNLMVKQEAKCPGDAINAMRRISNRHSVPYSLLWSLKYRPPKDLYVSAFEKLEAAYDKELRSAVSALDQERKLTEAKSWIGKSLSRAADALAGEEG